MWREDDFEDKGKQVKGTRKDKVVELSNELDFAREDNAERSDEEPRS